jgi:hypothetical protein
MLIGYAFAYEQATNLRQTPSQINPTLFQCVGSPADSSCAP